MQCERFLSLCKTAHTGRAQGPGGKGEGKGEREGKGKRWAGQDDSAGFAVGEARAGQQCARSTPLCMYRAPHASGYQPPFISHALAETVREERLSIAAWAMLI